jgi:putative SOS response-associated peptidase YedK
MSGMCGRFAFHGDHWPDFAIDVEKPNLEPNYNISPKDETPIIHLSSQAVAITSMQWGLRPSWSQKSTMEPINARIETVESKPMFREAYHQRRCVIPANGWYEWKTTPRGKVPFYHTSKQSDVVLMAGIYEQWSNDKELLNTFTVLTQDATSDISHIHNRMPVLIDSEEAILWMERSTGPSAPPKIDVHPVSREVNKTTAKGSHLIQRIRTLFD